MEGKGGKWKAVLRGHSWPGPGLSWWDLVMSMAVSSLVAPHALPLLILAVSAALARVILCFTHKTLQGSVWCVE